MIYLKWLEKQFGPDWVRISAAYNAGEQAVLRHGGVPLSGDPGVRAAGALLLGAGSGQGAPAATLSATHLPSHPHESYQGQA